MLASHCASRVSTNVLQFSFYNQVPGCRKIKILLPARAPISATAILSSVAVRGKLEAGEKIGQACFSHRSSVSRTMMRLVTTKHTMRMLLLLKTGTPHQRIVTSSPHHTTLPPKRFDINFVETLELRWQMAPSLGRRSVRNLRSASHRCKAHGHQLCG